MRALLNSVGCPYTCNFCIDSKNPYKLLSTDQLAIDLARPPYVMECSLSILRGDRLNRLQDTNCIAVAPGVESWMDYSNKACVGRTTGMQKFAELRSVSNPSTIVLEERPTVSLVRNGDKQVDWSLLQPSWRS
jgi:hypothetical protein